MSYILRHGLFLSISTNIDGSLLGVCSDGTPTEGHDPVTVLDFDVFPTMIAAKRWFERFQLQNCVRLQ